MVFCAWDQWDLEVAFVHTEDLSDILPTLLEGSVDSHLYSTVFTTAYQPRAQNQEVPAF